MGSVAKDTFLIMVSGIAGAFISRALENLGFWSFVGFTLITMVGLYIIITVIYKLLEKKA